MKARKEGNVEWKQEKNETLNESKKRRKHWMKARKEGNVEWKQKKKKETEGKQGKGAILVESKKRRNSKENKKRRKQFIASENKKKKANDEVLILWSFLPRTVLIIYIYI